MAGGVLSGQVCDTELAPAQFFAECVVLLNVVKGLPQNAIRRRRRVLLEEGLAAGAVPLVGAAAVQPVPSAGAVVWVVVVGWVIGLLV